ncbi:MAG: carbohydrate ABC transporter permease [Lachnospiraceae bacterium]|nr:carbohydrate ABC transporter permease [Lachnospiraceae bacterium]
MTKTKTKTIVDQEGRADYYSLGFWERNRLSGGYVFKKKVTDIGVSIVRFILLFGMCFMILQPILNKISVSFMTEKDLYNPIVISIPEHFSTEFYQLAAELMTYSKSLVNSLVVSFTIALLQIAVCTLVGYGFARFEFPLKKMWFAFVILVILIPPQTIASSLHLHFKFFDILGLFRLLTGDYVNLRGSALPYYLMSAGCMGLKNGLYIYMIRQFFRNIPVDLEEAAYVDGCGMLKTFVRIMLPEGKPILTSCFLFAFVWQWTDGFYSKMFLGKVSLLSVQLSRIVDSLGAYVQRINGVKTTISVAYSNAVLSTGTLMIIMPLIILYLFAQRAFVESISSTGIKM